MILSAIWLFFSENEILIVTLTNYFVVVLFFSFYSTVDRTECETETGLHF